MPEEFPQVHSGMFARDDEGGAPQELSIAEEFWLAMGRNDRSPAEEIAARLEAPPASKWLRRTRGGGDTDPQGQRQGEEPGTLTPRGVSVMPDTPTEVVNAWNRATLVMLMLVTKEGICGARVGDGEVDFLACAKEVDRIGGSSCEMATHQMGGKDSKKRNVLKMTLPPQGGGFVIPVQLQPPFHLSSAPRCFQPLSSLKQTSLTMCSTRAGTRHSPRLLCGRGSGNSSWRVIKGGAG